VTALPPRKDDWRTRAWARARKAAAVAWGRPSPDGIPFMTRGARYSVVFLFVLSFLLAGGSYYLSTSAVQGEVSSRASVVQLCQLGNESRAQQVMLWTRLVAISQPPPHETAAERAQRLVRVRAFLAYVHRLFAPRDCAAKFSG
jgi:hypothetical protein